MRCHACLVRYELCVWDFMLFRPLLDGLRVDCECNWPSFLATVFADASAFNGDLSQWDVAIVTDMSGSKSIRIQLEVGIGGDDVM
jgi:surface protein